MSGAPAAAPPAGHEIAVIGLAGRFPGAASLEELWQNLAAGRESVRRFSDEELAAAGVPAAVRRLPHFVNARAILDGADLFDAGLFGYGPKEAELIDPQHRVLLECAWEALEHAGHDPGRYRGLIGVYAGADANGGALINQLTAEDPLQGLIANDRDYLATRVCFKLDLRGPGLTIQTACSTSLVAVQVACQGLLGYQCDMALAGGVCIHFPQRSGYLYQEGGILSADGHCRPFDARAGGTVGGDGAGIVVLKRLADALADGDTIHAVIRGAAINNDGATKAGFTAPGIDGQAEVVALALAMADVDPATVTYVETHGTATQIGDPAEIAALTDVFRAHTGKQGFCAIGSLKGNLGHMSAAAGIGGLIKTVLMLERRTLLPSLHFERPNPMIDFAASPFYVNTELRAWPAAGQPRRAGVSSFGVGGTNAHVVVEEAPAAAPGGPSRPYQALVVSARTAGALERAAADLAAFLRRHPETPLADVAYTLQRGRALLRHKRLVVAADAAEAAGALAERGTTLAGEARQPAVVFMFPGQGAQQAAMARGIYRTEPEFRSLFDRCAARLEPLLDLDLRDALFGGAPAGAAAAALAPLAPLALLASVAISQPALFAVEYCLARLWMSWGVEPAAMIGHSLGELVAACLAGVMELDDALALVAARGRLIDSLPPGAMLAVAAAEADLPPLGPRLALAAVNAPAAVVLSGPPEAIAEIETVLREREIATTRLPIARAFHSAELEPILEPFDAELRRVALHPPRIPILSGLTGTWLRAAEATDPAYWVQQLRRTVRFGAGVRELASDPDRLLLEVGPGRSLGSLVRKHDAGLAERVLASLPGRRDDEPETRTLAAAVGQLYCRHAPVDWESYYRGETRRRLPLPTYPFERQRYWRAAPPLAAALAAAAAGATGAAGAAAAGPAAGGLYQPTWKRALPVRPASPAAPAPAPATAAAAAGDRWLVTGEPSALAAAVADRLRPEAASLVEARPCGGRDPAAWTALLARLAEEGRAPTRIVYASGLGDGASGLAASREDGLLGLLALIQACAAAGQEGPAEVTVVTAGTAEVLGDEAAAPWNRALLGPCQVAPQEIPHLRCRLLDVAAGDVARDLAATAGWVAADLAATDWPDWRLVRRGRHCWLAAYEPAAPAPAGRLPLRAGGVYLITGGLGNLGLAAAEQLAGMPGVKLLLTSRTGLPARGLWDEWLASHPARDPVCRRIQGVRRLEALGAEVLTAAADAADEAQMRRALELASARFGRLHGAIHAAGVAGLQAFQAVADTAPEHCERHLRAKARGTEVLARLLPGDLDFCLLFSSLSTVLGGVGLAAYAAANHVLDGFAEWMRRERGSRWTSIAWDAWQAPADDGQPPFGLSPAAGAEALRRILALPDAGRWLVAAPPGLEPRLRPAARPERPVAAGPAGRNGDDGDRHAGNGGGHAESGAAAARHPRPEDLDSEYVPPRDELEAELAEMWQELFGIDRIGVEDNFFKLGGDSLIAIQLATRLSSGMGVELHVNELFDQPTIAGLARRVAAARGEGRERRAHVETTLALIENLSDADVQRMLAEMGAP